MNHIPWLILGVLLGAGVLLFGYAICKAAHDADAHLERMRDVDDE